MFFEIFEKNTTHREQYLLCKHISSRELHLNCILVSLFSPKKLLCTLRFSIHAVEALS